MSTPLTEEQFKAALPGEIKKSVNQKLVDSINNTLSNPEMLEIFKENLIGFTSVMTQGKFKISQYVNAVKYVSYKLLGATNKDAYIKTFPDKYQNFIINNVSSKDIASYSTAYNKTKLVNLIFEQTLVPSHILNAPMYQEALNTQSYLMMNATSEKVRSDAANSILTHLKPPEVKKIELDIGLNESKTLQTLRATTLELAKTQRAQIESGAQNAKQIAAAPLIVVGETDAP